MLRRTVVTRRSREDPNMDQDTSWSGTRGLGSFFFCVYDFLSAYFHFIALHVVLYSPNAFASLIFLSFRSTPIILSSFSILSVSFSNHSSYLSLQQLLLSPLTTFTSLNSSSSSSSPSHSPLSVSLSPSPFSSSRPPIFRFLNSLYFLVARLFSLLVNKFSFPIVTNIYDRTSSKYDRNYTPLSSSQEYMNHDSTMHTIYTMIRDICACCMCP